MVRAAGKLVSSNLLVGKNGAPPSRPIGDFLNPSSWCRYVGSELLLPPAWLQSRDEALGSLSHGTSRPGVDGFGVLLSSVAFTASAGCRALYKVQSHLRNSKIFASVKCLLKKD